MKYGYILLWPHGFHHKDEIMTKISEKYKIIYHNNFKIDDLENFVILLYAKENKAHIQNKTKFLLNNNKSGQIYLYIFENEENDIIRYGKIKKSKKVEELKINIRNLYNPKLSNPYQRIMPLNIGVSHDHVIHSTDLSIEVPNICKLLKLDYEQICSK